MERILPIMSANWETPFGTEIQQAALRALEAGQVLYFPSLAFPISQAECCLLNPEILRRHKNIGYNPATGALGGTICQGDDAQTLKELLHRYADAAQNLFHQLLPAYRTALKRERTSLRPAAVEGRATSWRKDDTRLHVDSFPSAPVRGRRILRLFCNINPEGRARTWRVGEPFPAVAERFWPELAAPSFVKHQIFSLLHVTKGMRSEYDHYMIHLHDAMKADVAYQQTVEQKTVDFPAGSAWACFTDQVSHAAMAGQHQLEQTFTLPVEAMQDISTAPLFVMEHLAGRRLAA